MLDTVRRTSYARLMKPRFVGAALYLSLYGAANTPAAGMYKTIFRILETDDGTFLSGVFCEIPLAFARIRIAGQSTEEDLSRECVEDY
jgi:hypothetical protein